MTSNSDLDLHTAYEHSGLDATGIKIDSIAGAHLPRDIALLVIDVQKQFCYNSELTEKAKYIAPLVDQFRAAGISVYAIHYTDDFEEAARAPSKIDFFGFKPHPDDTLIRKKTMSAFVSSDIDKILNESGKKTLLACGFYRTQCVHATVMDAVRAGYRVTLLDDMTDKVQRRDGVHVKDLEKAEVAVVESGSVLKRITASPDQP